MWQFIYAGRHLHMNLIYTHIVCIEEYVDTWEDGMEECVLKLQIP